MTEDSKKRGAAASALGPTVLGRPESPGDHHLETFEDGCAPSCASFSMITNRPCSPGSWPYALLTVATAYKDDISCRLITETTSATRARAACTIACAFCQAGSDLTKA